MRKKRKIRSGPGGKFKASWKLPQFITASTKGDKLKGDWFFNCNYYIVFALLIWFKKYLNLMKLY